MWAGRAEGGGSGGAGGRLDAADPHPLSAGQSLDAEQRGKFCHLESSSFMLTLEHAESNGGDFDAAVEKATHQACADAMAPEELLERMGAGIEKLMVGGRGGRAGRVRRGEARQ